MGWSPEQVAGRLARDHGSLMISHETMEASTFSCV